MAAVCGKPETRQNNDETHSDTKGYSAAGEGGTTKSSSAEEEAVTPETSSSSFTLRQKETQRKS